MNNAELNLIIALMDKKGTGPLSKIASALEANAIMAKAETIIAAMDIEHRVDEAMERWGKAVDDRLADDKGV